MRILFPPYCRFEACKKLKGLILTTVTSGLNNCNSADPIKIAPDLYPGGEKAESDQELRTYVIFSTKKIPCFVQHKNCYRAHKYFVNLVNR